MDEKKEYTFGETVNYKRVRAANAGSTPSDVVDYTKMFELVYQKHKETVENAYQQLILVSECGSLEEFERQGYILKTSSSPNNRFTRTISLYKLESFGKKHIMSLEVKADFSDGVVKFVSKPLVNEMEEN
ncbi:hypothetical protein Staley_101 [Bacillus phage Staley]|uniref:Uncharacterized protein n=1 Tax=Bacillus phage Staley TaxID=1406792 RepID=U5PXY8_9CAUD|nr:hypothetical protein Staley_101 [Bacillus phage Staley]AGY48784.1 hypothetical protein Staley_101 [Bacillus phage Staley]